MKKIILLMCLSTSVLLKATSVSDVANIMLTVSNIVNTVAGSLDESKKKKLNTVAELLKQSYNVVHWTGIFLDDKLAEVKRAGNTLTERFECLNGEAPTCAALGCTSKNACLYQILQNIKAFLKPIVDTLIVSKAADGSWSNGALYSVASLTVIPEATRAKWKKTIAEFGQKLDSAISFADLLGLLIYPEGLLQSTMPAADKKKLEDSIKAEPVVIAEEKTESFD